MNEWLHERTCWFLRFLPTSTHYFYKKRGKRVYCINIVLLCCIKAHVLKISTAGLARDTAIYFETGRRYVCFLSQVFITFISYSSRNFFESKEHDFEGGGLVTWYLLHCIVECQIPVRKYFKIIFNNGSGKLGIIFSVLCNSFTFVI